MSLAYSSFKRILIKLSGESLSSGEQPFDMDIMRRIIEEIKILHNDMGLEICLVIGGGNIFRGNMGKAQGMDAVTSDYMGMLATMMNGLALQNVMTQQSLKAVLMTSLDVNSMAEPYARRHALNHIEEGNVVIFAGGLGCPFFSTDTAAVLRAAEMKCHAILKATKVDGAYDKDPIRYEDACFYERLSYDQVLNQELKVMDSTAVTLARDNALPIIIFNVNKPGEMVHVLKEQSQKNTLIWGAPAA